MRCLVSVTEPAASHPSRDTVGQDGAMSSAQRVHMHVGLPKTGTSYLQTVLHTARERLRSTGVLYAAHFYDEHFYAALDLQHLAFNAVVRPEAEGRWDALAAEVRAWPGNSVISAEVLAAASLEQARRAIESLAPAEVHVVLTVRDPGAHLVSTWQEDVKHGETATFADWCHAIAARDESRWNLWWYWRSGDLPSVLGRWAAVLPPEQLHVITVPPAGAPAGALWERFAATVGIEPGTVDLAHTPWANHGLGTESTAFLRRVNRERQRLDQVSYEHLVKGVLAHETLSRYPRPIRPELPDQARDFVEQRAKEWIAAVQASGAEVVGDFADLRPALTSTRSPDDVSHQDVLDVAVFATWELLLQVRDARATIGRLHDEVAGLHRDVDAARRASALKHLVRRASEHSPALMRARVAWWHTVEVVRALR